MMGWLRKQLDRSKDDGGFDAKIIAIKAKREAAESVLDRMAGADRRDENNGNPDGFERRLNGGDLGHAHPLPQV